jgi:hypothetical protein
MKDARADLFKDGVNALLLRLFRFYFNVLIFAVAFPGGDTSFIGKHGSLICNLPGHEEPLNPSLEK